ncbi:alpha/beta hydrolase family protein [Thiocapsa rosea]|uniref:Serine aminopeptidase S33 family n=1 Tax=Thiocapsa rosea TaxID=69360 RepID=A0A495VBT3_9GAMM|nr:alpha/beta fold hydrolase [Thiocapsa rosea]RKT45288.1 serine aminopeptidase S33 family [Thiocapsa rosea]
MPPSDTTPVGQKRERILGVMIAPVVAPVIVAVIAVCLLAAGLLKLESATHGLSIVQVREAGVPMTLYRPAGEAPAPVVVIAHGFAGSRQMMQAYAVTLARNGYIAVTFDFPGHGRNATPFVADLEDQATRLRILTDALEPAVALGLRQPGADGRLALLGHSMAGDVLVRFAQSAQSAESSQSSQSADMPVAASVLVSPYLSTDTDTASLRNLLFVYGDLEPEMLHGQGRAAIAEATGSEVEAGQTYGDPGDGSARRLVLAPGVEHIGVLYAERALAESLAWLDAAFARSGSGFLDRRGAGLGLLFLGILALAWPLSRLLPRVADRPLGAGLSWRRLLPVAIAPAVLTPLVLWRVPSDFLSIMLGDYLALHFGVYGILTAIGVWLMRPAVPAPHGSVSRSATAIAILAASVYATLAFAVPTDRFVTALIPGLERLHLVLAIFAGTLVYCLADEWATRGSGAARGGYWLTKLLFLFSLLAAVALNLNELFFLVIIVPAILVLFLIYGLLSGWVYRRTRHPAVAAVANAIAFACAVAVTFPLVAVR